MDNSEDYSTYVRASAQYCRDLFSSAERYFAANVLVEEVIAGDGGASGVCRDRVSTAFSDSASHGIDAVQSLQSFIDLHNGYPGQEVSVQGDEQAERLRRIATCGERLASMTSTFIVDADLQEQIWADAEYTRLFTDMADLICQSVGWQRTLAFETHGDI